MLVGCHNVNCCVIVTVDVVDNAIFVADTVVACRIIAKIFVVRQKRHTFLQRRQVVNGKRHRSKGERKDAINRGGKREAAKLANCISAQRQAANCNKA